MKLDLYYRILNVDSGATAAELKDAYHRAAKRNHPDMFPEQRRGIQQLAMMRINEAYLSITSSRGGSPDIGAEPSPARGYATSAPPQSAQRATNLPATLKDPAYVYYRRGFDSFRDGYSAMFRRDPREILRYLRETRTIDAYILKLTIRALQHFEQAYRYFLTVVQEYPLSVWAYDSRWKLKRVETYNHVYHRICERLAENLSRVQPDQ